MKNRGGKVFDGIPVGKEEHVFLDQYLDVPRLCRRDSARGRQRPQEVRPVVRFV